MEFWLEARRAAAEVKPKVIWLAESVHAAFVNLRRSLGLTGMSDCELYSAFDMTYDYDLWPVQQAAMAGKIPAGRYLEMLRFQESVLPDGAVKLRFTENHDQARTMKILPDLRRAKAWTAFAAFNKGAFLIYGGQESCAEHTPSLFEKDPVTWGDYALQSFLTRLAILKKDPALTAGRFVLLGDEPAVQAAWDRPGSGLYGVFNVNDGEGGRVPVQLPDGTYQDVLNDEEVLVSSGRIEIPESAAVLRFADSVPFKSLHSLLMDYSHPID
jgi:hypothetical protein